MKPWQLMLTAACAVLVALGISSLYTINEGEQALLIRFGKPEGGPRYAGLHFKLPLIDTVRVFDRRILKWDGDPNQIPTRDKKYITVDTTARWRITDPLRFYTTVETFNGAQSRLDDILDSTVRDAVSSHLLLELVRGRDYQPPPGVTDEAVQENEKPQTGREEIMANIIKTAKALTPEYGIELIDVKIKRINYVAQVRKRVYERMISERKKVSSQYRSEGEGEKADILGQMDRELKTIASGAQRRSLEIRGKADAKAAAIYANAYKQAPELYAFLRTLEAYRKAVGANSRLVLSADSDFYRFLKKLP